MKNVKWLINRLKAMKFQEVIWRLQERQLQRKEFKTVYIQNRSVTDISLSNELQGLIIDVNRLAVIWENKIWSKFEKLDLFGIFDYDIYKYINGMPDFKQKTNGLKSHFLKHLT